MGTPAYFFIGTGSSAKNVGRRQYDGYPEHMMPTLSKIHTVAGFKRVAEKLSDETFEQDGPTPWKDANYEYVYAFDNGKIRVFSGNDLEGKREVKPKTSRRPQRRSARQSSSMDDVVTTVYNAPPSAHLAKIGLPEVLIIGLGTAVGGYVLYKMFSGPTG